MWLKKLLSDLALTIVASTVAVSLLLAANTTVFALITSDVNDVKEILVESGAYSSVTPAVLDQIAKEKKAESGSELNLADPEIQKVATQTFDANFVQSTVESILDGTYAWLEKKTPEPTFNIDFEPAKNNFINSLSKSTAERLSKLPPCTFAQVAQFQSNRDIFALKCSPPGVNEAFIRTELQRQLASQPGIASETTITPSDIKNDQNEQIFQKLDSAPDAFKWADRLPWLILAIGALAGLVLVRFSPNRSQGIKRLGVTLVISGILLILTPPVIESLTTSAFSKGDQNAILKDIVEPIVNEFNDRAATIYYAFGIASLAGGTAALLFRKYKLQE